MTDDQNMNDETPVEEATTPAAEEPKKDQRDDKDAKIQELINQLARAMADLQNYKRRSAEEKMSFVKFANVEMLKAILPVLSNLDRSVTHLPENLKENEWAKGMVHIHDDLLRTFEKIGLTRMKTLGEKLDPKKHEAVMTCPGEKDIILEEFDPGYILMEEVVKVAHVKVGDGSETAKNS